MAKRDLSKEGTEKTETAKRRSGLKVLALPALLLVLALPVGARAEVDPLTPVSGSSPFPPACNGASQPQGSVEYRGSEVEPWIDANPTDARNLVALWQQDRFSDAGANGLGVGFSRDGGSSWTQVALADLPRFSRCAGAVPGGDGDYERATDPWFSFGPDGHGYGASLSFNVSRDRASAILVSESQDGGATWRPVNVIRRDTSPDVFNDKESITADYTDARYVYVVWSRREDSPDGSRKYPTWFARTTDGGATWEAAREIFDPGAGDGTIGDQIVVMPDGDLVNGYSVLKDGVRSIAVMRSIDKGANWSPQVVVASHLPGVVREPVSGSYVRTGDGLPELASDRRPGTATVYMVWQDARFSGYSQIAFSKSVDGGLSWSAAKRISTVADTPAFTPAIRVDAAGNLGVTYYDFRNDSVPSPALSTDVWFLRSTDGGKTFSEERLTPSSFDMRLAPEAGGRFVGDYTGLAATAQTFKPLFSQAGAGGTDVFSTSVRAPVATAPVTPSRPYPTPRSPAPSATPRPPAPPLRVARYGRLGRRYASFRIRCMQPRCAARLELSAVLRYRGKRRRVILGSRSLRIKKGRAILRVRLNRRARRLTSRRRRLSTRAVFTMRADRIESPVLLRRRR